MYDVLIIDDEPWARKVIIKLGQFESHGLQVIGEAEDGNQGLDMIEEYKPDLVITDMRMPGLDGVGLLKTISEKYPEVIIIAMSGYNDFIYLKQAIRSGVIEYLLKPVEPGELKQALERSVCHLEDKHRNVIEGFGMLHLFSDQKMMNAYLDYRRKVYEHLVSRSEVAIKNDFQDMSAFFMDCEAGLKEELASKIMHDFTNLLEEHIVKNGLALAAILGDEHSHSIMDSQGLKADEVFNHLSDLYIMALKTVDETKKKKRHLDIGEIQEYIDHHYAESISLESIANAFYVSKEHLSRSFKQKTGTTINDYLVMQRMDKAKSLLKESQVSIKDVAAMTGYCDLAYFYRVFKKYTGIAPGEYKRQEEA